MSVGILAPDLRRPLTSRRARPLVSTPELAAVAALTLLAAALRFARIGHQGFWFDEANTALLVHFSPGKMIGLIPQTESTPPLYYCVAWAWARVFGYGEAGLRSLSALAGLLTVPVVFAAGRKLISVRAGLIAAALTASNPVLIWYSQEARSYELLVLLTSLSLLAFAYARARPTPRSLAAWVIASAVALATHYYAVLAVVPEAIWLLVVHRRRRPVQIAVAVVGLCGLGLIPLAISQHGTGRSTWISSSPLRRRLGQIVPQFAAGFDGPAHGVLEPVSLAIVVLALVLLVLARSSDAARRGALVAAGLALAGFLLSLLLVAVGFDDLLTRNMLGLWPACALLVAGGLAVARPRFVGVVAAVALCVIGLTTAGAVAFDRGLERPDWRVVARALGTRPPAGGRAILVQHYKDLLPLSLYMPDLKSWRGHGGVRVSEFDVVSFTSPPSAGFCWWGAACNLWPSRMQASYPVAGFRPVSLRHALQFSILRIVAPHPVRLTQGEISRVLTSTHLVNDELLTQR